MDHFGQDFPTWPSLVWNLPPNSSVSLDFACAKQKKISIAWIGLREDKTLCLFSEHVGQTKIFRGSTWKCKPFTTTWLFKTVTLFYVSFSLWDCACLDPWECLLRVGSVWHLGSAPDPDGIIHTWLWHHLIGSLSGDILDILFLCYVFDSIPHSSDFVKNGNCFSSHFQELF